MPALGRRDGQGSADLRITATAGGDAGDRRAALELPRCGRQPSAGQYGDRPTGVGRVHDGQRRQDVVGPQGPGHREQQLPLHGRPASLPLRRARRHRCRSGEATRRARPDQTATGGPGRGDRQRPVADSRRARGPRRVVAVQRHPPGNRRNRHDRLRRRDRQAALHPRRPHIAVPRARPRHDHRRTGGVGPPDRCAKGPPEPLHQGAGVVELPALLRLRLHRRRPEPADVPLRHTGLLRPRGR